MASSKWKSWAELAEIASARRIVFWGASNWIERTLNIQALPTRFIVDNNPSNQGIDFMGMPVVPPAQLLSEPRSGIYVVITTVNYPSVIDELTQMGFVMGEEFCCTPLLNERQHKDALKSVERQVLVSSPLHAFSPERGGGLYLCDTLSREARKVYSGKCRGVVHRGGVTYVVDMLRGIVLLDDAYREVDVIDLGANAEPHGLCLDGEGRHLYVAQPGRDSIAVYDLVGRKLAAEFFMSGKWHSNKKDNHHVNDLFVHDGGLFVSMFSLSGNWMNDCYDGGIVEMDANTGVIRGTVATGLWMPHSVQRVQGKITVLDSMRGELVQSTYHKLGAFPGFVRGLDHDGNYFYIGSTEHRYPEKLTHISLNISLDCGFHVFDAATRMSRFFPLDQAETIHSLAIAS